MSHSATEKSPWANGDLHSVLVNMLPAYVDNPFSDSPRIKVYGLAQAAEKSHEGVYKWLRRGRLTPANAKLIIDIAHGKENAAVLRQLGRRPPKIEELTRFCFA
jgi:hypothetical protein